MVIVDTSSYRNQIPKLTRFARIRRNMNAYLRGMHGQRKHLAATPSYIKTHHCT
jgi:hypothetical protein